VKINRNVVQDSRGKRAAGWKCLVVGVGAMVILAGCSSATTNSSSNDGQAGSTNSVLNAKDQLAMPLPRLASDVSITRHANGSATATFSLNYAVANTSSSQHVRADDATIVVHVARQLLPSGPSPADPVFTKGFVDNQLDQSTLTHQYSVTIPAKAVSFLKSKGLAFRKSETGTTTTTVPSSTAASTDALQLISVDVQQHRDFRHVDGSYDWTEGNFFTGASHPLTTTTTHGGTLSVTNQTSQICNYATSGSVTNYGDPDTFNNCVSSNLATPVALSGVATECFNQNDDSNPQGFAQENSAGAGTPESPGSTITEPVVANDGAGVLSSTTETSNASWAVTVGKAAVVTSVNLLAGGPFGTIVEATLDIAGYFSGTSCDNDPNVMTLSATDPTGGAGASYGWAIDEEGMQDVYGSSFNDGNNAIFTAAQLAYSSQVYDNNGSYQNPWLAEQVTRNCGVGNGTSACNKQTNSAMNVQWTTNNPCPTGQPYTFNGNPQAGIPKNCAQDTVSSPAVSSCGTSNSTCPSQTAPGSVNPPNVVGEPYSQAVSTLAAAGLGIYPTNLSPSVIITSQTPGPSDDGYNGDVQTPDVVQVFTGSSPPTTTTPTTAAGPDVAVPNIVGDGYCTAQSGLAAVGLTIYSTNTNSTCQTTVVTQSPTAGEQVAPGTRITVTISTPPPSTTTTTTPPPTTTSPPPPTTTTTLPASVPAPNGIGTANTKAVSARHAVGLVSVRPKGPIRPSGIITSPYPLAGLPGTRGIAFRLG
jgi:PASTA domain